MRCYGCIYIYTSFFLENLIIMEASHVNILNINGFLIFFKHLEGSRVVKEIKKGLYHKQLKLEKYICIESHSFTLYA